MQSQICLQRKEGEFSHGSDGFRGPEMGEFYL